MRVDRRLVICELQFSLQVTMISANDMAEMAQCAFTFATTSCGLTGTSSQCEQGVRLDPANSVYQCDMCQPIRYQDFDNYTLLSQTKN